MARQPARQNGARQAQGPEPLPLWMKLFLTVSLAPLIAVLFPTFMLLGLGMLPTVAVYLADRSRNKSFATTVALTNLCGVLPSLAELWDRGQTMQAANALAVGPMFWLLPLGAAGIGWLIFMGMPPLIAGYYQTSAEARIRTLQQKQQRLVETWGEEVRVEDEADAAEGDETAETGS